MGVVNDATSTAAIVARRIEDFVGNMAATRTARWKAVLSEPNHVVFVGHTVAAQAVRSKDALKLQFHSAAAGRMVEVVRSCLFSLADNIVSKHFAFEYLT
ncbi:hypothetical protein PsorP6_014688 [Peronosclerospora sorghi]|uniref:Uncharacterized protein n=1 Tax=Peronosclerospora sorghi TaxID=230839 RepID=A0ACC0VTE0_9STRA|nr:hypothetical protein PsorP6_014688 [Peronosclerospora sorghi]